jgi:hypothetical protein
MTRWWLFPCLFLCQSVSALTLTVRSEPLGVVSEQTTFHPSGAQVATPEAVYYRRDLGLLFTHWEITPTSQHPGCADGRCVDPTGQSLPAVRFSITADTTAVAHYRPATEDTDGDGVTDALEIRYFGTLAVDTDDDSDADMLSLGTEMSIGTNPRFLNLLIDGAPTIGIAPLINLILQPGLVYFRETSWPVGVLGNARVVPINALVSTVMPPEASGSLRFAHWVLDGNVAVDVAGVSLVQPGVMVSAEVSAVARYVHVLEDSDSNGVSDWFELRNFQNLGLLPTNDDDADGLSLMEEFQRALSPRLHNTIAYGGVTISTSSQFQLAMAPGLLPRVEN